MIYTRKITSAKGGSVTSPTVTYFPLTVGLIYQFDLYLPSGSAGLLKVRVAEGGAPLWPSEPEEWFYGENITISFPERYFITSPDCRLLVWHYNEDDTYDHAFQLRVGQVSSDLYISSFLPSAGFESLAEALKATQEAQVQEKTARQEMIARYFGR